MNVPTSLKATLVVCTKSRNRVRIRQASGTDVPEPEDQTSDCQQSTEEPEGVGKSVDTTPAASSPDSEEPSSALDTPTRS